jgi:hypothetical protein
VRTWLNFWNKHTHTSQEFNELENHAPIPGTDAYRVNFWGYSTVGFFGAFLEFFLSKIKLKSH